MAISRENEGEQNEGAREEAAETRSGRGGKGGKGRPYMMCVRICGERQREGESERGVGEVRERDRKGGRE